MTHKTLTLAILFSTGIHLAVLLPLLSQRQMIVIDSPNRPLNHFAMVVAPSKTASQPAQTQTLTIPAKPVHQQHTKPTQAVNADDNQPVRTTHAKPPQIASSVDPQAQLEHDVLEYLHSEFRVRFQYPLLARKRGWSGEVVIALNVNHHGRIDEVAIQKSSGYPILDNNAVQTFRAIGAVTPAIQSRINNKQYLSIPVIYTLTGG